MRVVRSALLVVVLLCAAVVAVAGPAQANTATTVYVATDGSGSADCLTPATACATVSEGVAAAQTLLAGSSSLDVTVSIAAGSYYDIVNVNVPAGDSLTLAGDTASDTSIDGDGGSTVISVYSGVVTISGLTLTDGIGYYGGGIYNGRSGTLTVSGSTLSGNTAYEDGGGIYNYGTMTVSGSTLSGNSAVYEDGGILNSGTMTVSGSTLSGNSGYFVGGISNYGTMTVSGSTLSSNSANFGPGGISNSGTMTVSGSILSNSSCDYAVTDGGFNVTSDDSCVSAGGSSVVDSATIGLGVLAANGSSGPWTQAIDATSSAHQLVPTSSGLCAATDERGLPRPGVNGASSCDAGAFELQDASGPTPVTVTVTGSERVGGRASFATSQTLPDGITLTGTVTCTAVTGSGGDVPIAGLAAGGYTIDPATCSGLGLDGTGASGYSISYAGGTFTAIAVTPTKLKGGRTGTKYNAHLSATGGTAPYSYTVTTGSLPDGISLSTAGVFSGTPTTSGPTAFTVTVTDADGVSVSADYTLLIGLQITPAKLLPATFNKPYTAGLNSNGTGPLTWAVVSGALPAGLTLDATSGKISGTPTAAGHNSFTVQVTDSSNPAQTGRITYYLTVQLAVTSALKTGTHNKPYSATLTANGGTAPYTWTLTTGTLPDGLTLNPDGHITGTPTTTGTTKFSLTVTDAATPANTLTRSYSIVIK